MSKFVDCNINDLIMYENDLRKLGFTGKEAAVFLTMHKIGAAPASTLARLTKIKRTSMYDILNSLLQRGFITSFKQGKYSYYAIDDVNKLLYREREKVRVAKDLVKKLKESPGRYEGLKVNYYKGEEGYKEMYEDMLRARPKEICGWLNLEKFYQGIDPVREEEWTKERIKAGIKVRLLIQDTKGAGKFVGLDKEMKRETRLVKKENMFSTTCLTYEDHIVFFDSTRDLTTLRIHHPEFYRMQQQIFEMNWDHLRK